VQPLFLKPKNTIMLNKEKQVSASAIIILLLVFINALILKLAFVKNETLYMALIITLPLLFIVAYFEREKK
jgi:hypothetical protein